jgi:hypothetical protein
MKVFISWSGPRSRYVAGALRGWLKMVLQAVDPWMTDGESGDGQHWNADLESELYKSVFGIICVTPANRSAPWLLFEAGALAAQVKANEFLCGYLIDLGESELAYPLAQYSAMKWDRDGTFALVRAINLALRELEPKSALEDSVLDSVFGLLWPDLERKLAQAPKEQSQQHDDGAAAAEPPRILSEILEETRVLSQQIGRIEQRLQQHNGPAKSVEMIEAAENGAVSALADSVAMTLHPLPEKRPAKKPVRAPIPPPPERAKLICPACGERDDSQIRIATREITAKIDHHDLACESCKTVLRQFHTVKTDEDQVRSPCVKDCPYRLTKR